MFGREERLEYLSRTSGVIPGPWSTMDRVAADSGEAALLEQEETSALQSHGKELKARPTGLGLAPSNHIDGRESLMRSALAAVLLLASALPQSALSQSAATRGTVDLEAADCSRFQSTWNGLRVAYGTQHTTAALGAGTLDVRPEDNGGVQVLRGSGNTYSITACIAAGAATLDAAQQAVRQVKLVVSGESVTTTGGGSDRHASVQLIVEAPRGARIHARTTNGPIGFEDADGTFSADASNGPLAFRNVSGTVTARTQNGPISIHGGSGTYDVEASNGPITVAFDAAKWDGRLDARTHNGPLSVTLPEHFDSGIEISSSSHAPWSCRVSECRTSEGDREYDSRRLRLGRDPVVVRISTNNGPVAIRE
jgi:hypothetical protein